MRQIVAVGLDAMSAIFQSVLSNGGTVVTLMRDLDCLDAMMTHVENVPPPALVLIRLDHAGHVPHVAAAMARKDLVWVGVMSLVDADLTRAGYRAGAASMIPLDSPPGIFADLVCRLTQGAHASTLAATQLKRSERGFRGGQTLDLPPGHVCVIRHGVVALHSFDFDGTFMLLGFAGAGEAIISNGERAEVDNLSYVAHTTVSATTMPWDVAIRESEFHDAHCARIASMEAWARAQADPRVENRIVQTLRVLARLVGRPHPRGTFVGVRITHAQLAAAVGATRSTVTRLVGLLRQSGALLVARNSDNEVGYCLPVSPREGQDRHA